MRKDQYNIEIESLLGLPACVYWKNQNGIYLGCNDLEIETWQLGSHKDFVGSTLWDHCDKLDPTSLNNTDNKIINIGLSQVLIEAGKNKLGCLRLLTIKKPIHNNRGRIVGLLGISFDLTDPTRLTSNICNLEDLKIVEPNKITLGLMEAFSIGIDQNNFQLTPREKEILYYIKRGKTAKEVARFLGISYRTVESHLSNIKVKMKCNSKSQLVDLITSLSL